MRVVPAIDLYQGRCVRLEQGKFGTSHSVADDPVAVARHYREAGAELIHVVDLDGARDGVRQNRALVAALVKAAAPVRVELGGGLRTLADLAAAARDGVWRFVLGSAALKDPAFVRAALAEYGDRIAVGIDAKNGRVSAEGWREDSGRDYLDFAREMEGFGVRALIFTDIATDGMLSGPGWEPLRALRATVGCELTASGGVTSLSDLRALRDMGMEAAIIGKALYAGRVTLKDALSCVAEERGGPPFDLNRLFQKSELIPVIVQHGETEQVLMLGFANRQAVEKTLETKTVWFYSRSRNRLWNKGETSGHFLHVDSMWADCDEDTLLLRCRPAGPTCHTGSVSCFFTKIREW